MLKKIVHLILTLLVIFTQASICFGQNKSAKRTFRVLVYGLPDFERQNAQNVIAEKWGIEFYPVAGCTVSQELQDSVEQENKKVDPLIERKYGKDWYKRYDKEVNAEFEIEKKVSAQIDKLNYIRKKQTEMEKEGNGLHYIMSPVSNSTKYNVSIEGWGKWKGEDEWLTYYKLVVDYKTKTVKLLSDKISKEQ